MNSKKILIVLLLFASIALCVFGQSPRINNGVDDRAVYLDGSRVIPATAAFRTQLGIPNHDKFAVDSAGAASYPTSVYASSGLELATKEYAESLAAQSSLRYYYQEVSDGSGRELLASGGISVQAYETLPTLTTTNYLLVDQFITATGTPNIASLNTGIYENVIYVEKFSGVNAQIVFELYKITTGSVSTLLATSASYVVTNAATQVIHCDFSISSTTAIGVTDRLYIRQYAKKTSAGADVVLRNWYGGTTEGYFGLPISVQNFARTDLSNITQVDALSNLGLASQTLTNASFSNIFNTKIASSGASLTAALDPAGRNGSSTQNFDFNFATATNDIWCSGILSGASNSTVLAYLTGNQTIPSGVWTNASFTTIEFESVAAEYDNIGTYTAPVNLLVSVFAVCTFDAAAGGQRAIQIYKNGAPTTPKLWDYRDAATAVNFQPSISGIVKMSAGDTLSVMVYQNQGNALAASNAGLCIRAISRW